MASEKKILKIAADLKVDDIAQKIIAYLFDNLSEHRKNHILKVAQIANELSKNTPHVTIEQQRICFIAALGHDITKECTIDCHHSLFDKISAPQEWYQLPEKILHSKSGYIFLNMHFGIDDPQIRKSIEYHTTGNIKMDLSAKILFVADYLSSLKKAEYKKQISLNIESIILNKIKKSLSYLIKKSLPVHFDTISYYNYLIYHESI